MGRRARPIGSEHDQPLAPWPASGIIAPVPLRPTEVFTKTVDDYVRFRPDYPAALLTALREGTGVPPPAAIVELGAGTGIATRWLAAAGYRVTAVEPNPAMREAALAENQTNVRFVAGTAEATGLPSGCAELVVAAQAWHWFDLEAADRECARLLAPESPGRCAAFWNIRVQRGFTAVYDAAHKRHVTGYGERRRAAPTLAALRARGGRFVEIPHHQELDLEGLLGRARSSSYVAHLEGDRGPFDEALRGAFEAHAQDGRVRLEYRTTLVVWHPRGDGGSSGL